MLKRKQGVRFLGLLLALICIMQPAAVSAAEYAPYDTYTYSLDMEAYYLSPHAYVPEKIVKSVGMGLDVAYTGYLKYVVAHFVGGVILMEIN